MPENEIAIADLTPSEEAWLARVIVQANSAMATAADSGDKSKEPYGNVTYADPGYQKDGKKRYPLDSETHVRAAWSYINKSKNADKYSTDQVSSIKSKVKAAGKKYDINYSDDKATNACLHTAFASKRYGVTDSETEQIKAAQALRQQALRLLVMEAEEIADEGDEDTWDLECLLGAVRQIEQFISSEQWELYLEEVEEELANTATAAAKKDGDHTMFACPSCGSAVRLQRRTKTKLVSAAADQAQGDATMPLSEAEITAIAQATAQIMMQAQAAARTVEDGRAGGEQSEDPKLVLKAAEERKVEDTRAGGEQSSDPKAETKDLPTVASDEAEASTTAPTAKNDPSDSNKIAPQPGSSDSGPDGKSEKQPAKAADSTLPDAPSGGEQRSTDEVRANASEAGGTAASESTEAFNPPPPHADEKAVNDKKNPARAAMDDEEQGASAAMPPQFQKKGDDDADDKASAASDAPAITAAAEAEAAANAAAASLEKPAIQGGSFQRSYRLSDPNDLAAYLRSLEAAQASKNVLTGMGAMNQVPTETQVASAARRVTGGQSTVAGEAPIATAAKDEFDLSALFSR